MDKFSRIILFGETVMLPLRYHLKASAEQNVHQRNFSKFTSFQNGRELDENRGKFYLQYQTTPL